MGASRKLQTEIDRVLKKVQEGVQEFDTIWDKVYDTDNANLKEKFEGDLKKEIKKLQRYRDQIKTWQQSSEIKDKKVGPSYEQALNESRKLIEREMERFKVCEKEMKVKAFSKEGLGQQPKTDPKEKAKSETRDWLNNVVGDLEIQIDNFEAELEAISGKKGKTKNPQLTRLEASISRHKAHVMKLELILRLLDNDELSPDQVNDLKYYLDDYIECNQVDFERFSDIDELYTSLPLDKVDALEDMVTLGTSGLVKAALLSTTQQNTDQDQCDETASQDSNPDSIVNTPPAKTIATGLVASVSASPCHVTGTQEVRYSVTPATVPVGTLPGGPKTATVISAPAAVQVQGIAEKSAPSMSSSPVNSSKHVEEDSNAISFSKPEVGLERNISREMSNQESTNVPMSFNSVGGISSTIALGSLSAVSELSNTNVSSTDKKVESGNITSPVVSQLHSRLPQQISNISDATISNDNVGEIPGIGGRTFSHSIATSQWRPQSAAAFQNPNEIRGRPEIAPDQREKYLQRLQQVQQQGHDVLLTVPLPGANLKQFPMQQDMSISQQLNSQSAYMPTQLGLGLNAHSAGLSSVASTQLQNPARQLSSQNLLISTGPKDVGTGEELQQQRQQRSCDDMNAEATQNSGLSKNKSDENLKLPPMIPGTTPEGSQLARDSDLSSGKPLQPSQSSASLGVIGRRSIPDLGPIGDNLGASAGNFGGLHDRLHTLQFLEAALHRLPQPKDSECIKGYIPRRPAVTPPSFPQTQADIFKNPAFWKRLGVDPLGIDTLFFAFYYQQNTYQQYLAAKELKRQSWRYHKQYSTWFQRHEEPEVTTDDYEKGTYVYFDFHVPDGWCQRVKGDFTFEYKHLEDELVV